MCDVYLKSQQKTQKYKADFILGKTYHAAFDCFFRNRPIEITVTGCQSILSVPFESCPRDGLVLDFTVTVFNHLHYIHTVIVRTEDYAFEIQFERNIGFQTESQMRSL